MLSGPGALIWQGRDAVPSFPSQALLSGEQGVQLSQVGEKTSLALPGKLIHWGPKAADRSSGLLVAIAELLLRISSKISWCLQQFLPKELSGPVHPGLLSATQPEAGDQMPPATEQCFGYIFETLWCQWATRSQSQGGKETTDTKRGAGILQKLTGKEKCKDPE